MKSTEFVFWLQGFFELSESNTLSEKQVEIIKNHLKLVFYHEIDPSYSSDSKVQEEMQMIHDGRTNIKGELLTDKSSRPISWPEPPTPPEDRVRIDGIKPRPPVVNIYNNKGKVKC